MTPREAIETYINGNKSDFDLYLKGKRVVDIIDLMVIISEEYVFKKEEFLTRIYLFFLGTRKSPTIARVRYLLLKKT